MKLYDLNTKRKQLFKKWDDLDNVIHVLEATANVYYSNLDKNLEKGWKELLSARDRLKPFIESEIEKLRKEIDRIDIKIKEDENG